MKTFKIYKKRVIVVDEKEYITALTGFADLVTWIKWEPEYIKYVEKTSELKQAGNVTDYVNMLARTMYARSERLKGYAEKVKCLFDFQES